VFANGTVIRAQERSENLYASIDLVANKLARQLRRFKERQSDHGHRATPTAANDVLLTERPTEDSLLEGKEAQLPSPGVRRKYFAMPAMSLEEARHQLEVIDHDFYLFRDKETDELQVIYHRNHGGFGVIQARN
jgi:putative sigma-54 modulation protein